MQIGSVWFSLKNYLIEKLTPYNDPVTDVRYSERGSGPY